MDTHLLTPKEVAVRLRVSERTVVRLVKGGRIPARAVLGKMRLYWPEVVQALPRVSVATAGGESVGAVRDLRTRLKMNARNFYRTQPGGAA